MGEELRDWCVLCTILTIAGTIAGTISIIIGVPVALWVWLG